MPFTSAHSSRHICGLSSYTAFWSVKAFWHPIDPLGYLWHYAQSLPPIYENQLLNWHFIVFDVFHLTYSHLSLCVAEWNPRQYAYIKYGLFCLLPVWFPGSSIACRLLSLLAEFVIFHSNQKVCAIELCLLTLSLMFKDRDFRTFCKLMRSTLQVSNTCPHFSQTHSSTFVIVCLSVCTDNVLLSLH